DFQARNIREAVIPGFRALVFRKRGERRGWEPPLRFRLPRPGLEALRWIAATKVDVAVGIHQRPFDQEVRVDEVTAGAAKEPGIDAVNTVIAAGAQRAVITALRIERELVPIPLRLGANQTVTLRVAGDPDATSVAGRSEQPKQVLLGAAPAPMPAHQIAVSGEVAAREIVGGSLRLRINLHAHLAGDPVIGATCAAQRPTVETLRAAARIDTHVLAEAGPAAIDLDIASGLLLDRRGRLEHWLQVGGMRRRYERNGRDCAGERLLQHH